MKFLLLQSLRLAMRATSLYTREAHYRLTAHLKGVTHYTLHRKACEKEYEQIARTLFSFSGGKTCFMVGVPSRSFFFLLTDGAKCDIILFVK